MVELFPSCVQGDLEGGEMLLKPTKGRQTWLGDQIEAAARLRLAMVRSRIRGHVQRHTF